MKKNRGFTLIEVVVVTLVIGLLLSAVYVIFDQGVKMYAKDASQVANQQSLRTVMTSIEKNIRKADHSLPMYVDTAGCLVIQSALSPKNTYCLVSNKIMLNANVVIDRIATFTHPVIKIDLNSDTIIDSISVTITITTLPDSMGQTNSVSSIINARLKGR